MTARATARWSADHRRRRREGLIVLRNIEVNEAALIGTLRAAQFIGENEADPEGAASWSV